MDSTYTQLGKKVETMYAYLSQDEFTNGLITAADEAAARAYAHADNGTEGWLYDEVSVAKAIDNQYHPPTERQAANFQRWLDGTPMAEIQPKSDREFVWHYCFTVRKIGQHAHLHRELTPEERRVITPQSIVE